MISALLSPLTKMGMCGNPVIFDIGPTFLAIYYKNYSEVLNIKLSYTYIHTAIYPSICI